MDFLFEFRRIFRDVFFNIFTMVAGLFIHRDKHIILFGGRYGNRFAGNTRFLFQYCHENKERLGFEKVIWATRESDIKEELSEMGYEVVLVRSREGVFWHLKAGIHIISGTPTPQKLNSVVRPPDMATVLSMGAIDYNLWHCAFLPKATPRDRNTNLTKGIEDYLVALFNKLYRISFFRRFVFYPGGWGYCVWAVQSESEAEEYPEERSVIIGMPELCPCVRYTDYENRLIEHFKNGGKKIILFTPTWRSEARTPYKSPLEDGKFREFLRDNGYYWVEKLHPAANKNMESDIYDPEISMLLDSGVDLNTICQMVDIMITDYSSTYQKAIWYYKPFSFYTADKDYYLKKDMGLNDEFLQFVGDGFCEDIDSLMKDISKKMQGGYVDRMRDKYDEWRNMYFNVDATDYETICKRMFDPKLIGNLK